MKGTPALGLRIKGNYFGDPFYFRTDVTTGVCRTPAGVRICTLTADFLLGLLNAISFECGRGSSSVLKSVGKRWGEQFIKRLDRELSGFYQHPFTQLPLQLIHVCLDDAFAAHGYGRLRFLGPAAGAPSLYMAEISDSVLPTLISDRDRPSDHLMAGFLSAVMSHALNSSLECLQTECPSCGHERSRFLAGPIEDIAELEGWYESQKPLPTHDDVIRYHTTRHRRAHASGIIESNDGASAQEVEVSQ